MMFVCLHMEIDALRISVNYFMLLRNPDQEVRDLGIEVHAVTWIQTVGL